MTVLADTSAWIEYLRGTVGGVAGELRASLRADRLVLAVPVVAELLHGAGDAAELSRLEKLLGALPCLEARQADGVEAGRIGFHMRRVGMTVPALDLLVAAVAIRAGAELLHLDRHFDLIARHSALKIRTPRP